MSPQEDNDVGSLSRARLNITFFIYDVVHQGPSDSCGSAHMISDPAGALQKVSIAGMYIVSHIYSLCMSSKEASLLPYAQFFVISSMAISHVYSIRLQ